MGAEVEEESLPVAVAEVPVPTITWVVALPALAEPEAALLMTLRAATVQGEAATSERVTMSFASAFMVGQALGATVVLTSASTPKARVAIEGLLDLCR